MNIALQVTSANKPEDQQRDQTTLAFIEAQPGKVEAARLEEGDPSGGVFDDPVRDKSSKLKGELSAQIAGKDRAGLSALASKVSELAGRGELTEADALDLFDSIDKAGGVQHEALP